MKSNSDDSLDNLIDYDFCRSHHGFSTDAETLAWFQNPPFRDFRTFSPRFSPIAYLLANPDLIENGTHPVRHFLFHGYSEGRSTEPVKLLRLYEEQVERATSEGTPSVAFVLHIYYESHVESFLDRLNHIGLDTFDVFISTGKEIADSYGTIIADALGPRLRAVRVVPNRGRNLAPLFVAFSDILGDYDAICHCHSKESRYSGRRQSEWADYLISAMIGPDMVCSRHAHLIASGRCDLIAPMPFAGLPPWAMHSLSNEATLHAFQQRLGLPRTAGFMTYPVGGMFWMGRDVVSTFARLELTLDDFPDEPSASDGEIHHALERLLGRVAGRRMAYFDQVTGQYYDAIAALQSELSRFPSIEDLSPTIDRHSVISFDFFDTLCFRSTGDEDWAKGRVGTLLGDDYRTRRNEAEARLRATLGESEDVSLSAIAVAMASDGFADAWQAVALERDIDLGTLVPRDDVIRGYRHAIEEGKSVLIASDTYYDRGFIESFLSQHKLPRPDQILVSSEVGLRKDRGDIWPLLRQMCGNHASLHVGDNVFSDIQRAAGAGFSTFYVPHWRNALLETSGLSAGLLNRSRHNPAFGSELGGPEDDV